jgi:hypothetical protein
MLGYRRTGPDRGRTPGKLELQLLEAGLVAELPQEKETKQAGAETDGKMGTRRL